MGIPWRVVCGVVVSGAIALSCWQWCGVSAERNELIGQMGAVINQSLQRTADHLQGWADQPSPERMVAVEESWSYVKLVHDRFVPSMPPQWHQAWAFESFLEQFSKAGASPEAVDQCLAEGYVRLLGEWAVEVQRLWLQPTARGRSQYEQIIAGNVGKLSLRERVCP